MTPAERQAEIIRLSRILAMRKDQQGYAANAEAIQKRIDELKAQG